MPGTSPTQTSRTQASPRANPSERLASLYIAATALLADARTRDTSDRGASLVEYSLLIALIAVVVIGSVALFGGSVNNNFSQVASEVTG